VRRGLRIGYLPQEPSLPAPDKTVAANLILGLHAAGLTHVGDEARGWQVRWGLIAREDITKRVADLSVGQQRKVELGILIGSDPDALLLDEPTNHLSFDVLESLQQALTSFGGPVLVVTHDRRLIRQFPRQHWELNNGKLIVHEVQAGTED
jgi:macrolide transport system ATP-binding/permease protein